MQRFVTKAQSVALALIGALLPAGPTGAQPREAARPAPAGHIVGKRFEGQSLKQARNQLLDLWVKDQNFNAQMRKLPVATLKKLGVNLTQSEERAVANMNWSASNADLIEQVKRWKGAAAGGWGYPDDAG